MSEFSESFQYYNANRSAAVALLRAAGVGGLIAANNERCVSFVVDDPEREASLIAASRGVLARYYYGEDHGLWIRFYRDGQPLTALVLVWDQTVGDAGEPEEVEPTSQIVEKLVGAGVIGARDSRDLHRILEEFSPEDPSSREQAGQRIPTLLGFAAFRWISTTYVLDTALEDIQQVYPGAETVEIDAP